MNKYPQPFQSLLPVILFLLLAVSARGQYKDGYVVSAEGDTTVGQIKYLDWDESPDRILFKQAANDSEIEMTATQLQLFYINSTNERFVSKRIGEIAVYEKTEYGTKPSLSPTEFQQVFLQNILQGPEASLFKYVNEAKDEHFFIETPISFQELVNYSFMQKIDGKLYEVVIDKYKEQLTSICSNASNFKASTPKYQEAQLKSYLTKYNSCFLGETIVYKSENPKITFDLMLSGGVEDLRVEKRLPNDFLFGAGVRINFPKNYYNRFARINLDFVPNSQTPEKKNMARFLSIGVGKYWGYGKFHPYIIFVSRVLMNKGDVGKSDMVSINLGFNYKKQLEIEIGNWNNFIAPFYEKRFIYHPSIKIHYYLSLSRKNKI